MRAANHKISTSLYAVFYIIYVFFVLATEYEHVLCYMHNMTSLLCQCHIEKFPDHRGREEKQFYILQYIAYKIMILSMDSQM